MELSPLTVLSIEQLLGQAVALVGADFGDLQLLDAERRLVLVAAKGFAPDFVARFRVIERDGPTLCARAARDGRAVVVADVAEDPRCDGFREDLLRHGVRSVRSTPLLDDGGKVIGVLSTHRRSPAPQAEWEHELLRVQGREVGRRVEWLLRG